MTSVYYKRIFIILSLLLFAGTLEMSAAVELGKKVRVGWFESVFNHTDASGRRTGYAYEYQCRVASNTGWQYEYVNGSWTELYEMLKRGEIDLLADVSCTPARQAEVLFSEQEMGTEDYYILALANSKSISAGDFTTLQGKRVAVRKNSMQKARLEKWMQEHNVQLEIVECTVNDSDYLNMMERGDVDAVANICAFDIDAKERCIPVARLGIASVSFAINKQRPDLKRDIDKAMSQIHAHNAYFNHDLHEKYFAHTTIASHLPNTEKEWLKEHGAIRIGYRDNYLPFCASDKETGEVSGLLADFIEKVTTLLPNVKIEAVPFPTINEAFKAVRTGEVDVAFPNGMGTFETEESHLLATDAFVNSAEMAIVRSNDYFHSEGKVRAAINASNPNYLSLISDKYPDWELVHFSSTSECLKGVAEGKADLLLASNYRLSVLDKEINKYGLKAVGTGAVIPLNFAINAGNCTLFSIMSRLKYLMSISEIHASLARNSEIGREATFADFVKEHFVFAFLILAAVCGLFAFLFIKSRREHRKAQLANQAKSRFFFNMSHDIRTPMNAIMGYTELLEQNINNETKRANYLGKIRSASEFLLRLINNVLEMARIESGKMEVIESPHKLKTMISSIIEIYSGLFTKNGVKFVVENNLSDVCCFCDSIKIEEVFLNILSNALKYTPKGGTVKLCINQKPSETPGYINVETVVSDTGRGMSKDYLPHVFESFTREESFTDNKISGTGLGLAIVKRMVEVMNGTITVDSELGKGTTFTLNIPHRIADESLILEKEKTDATDVSFEGKHILLAEDNELNSEIAIEILSSLGITVEHAEDGLVCVDKYINAPTGTYDLILMDVQMPNLNGYEATRQIRAIDDQVKAKIPIIAMTANAFDDDRRDALNAGMDGHLAKPVEVSVLIQTLLKVFSKTK